MTRVLVLLALALGLAGCKQTPPYTPVENRCGLVTYSLEQPLPGERDLESVVKGLGGDWLFLSGGSQKGAFGAGFLEGWAGEEGLPDFNLVTGVSTGALQATPAFIGRPDMAVRGYTIDSESEFLNAYVDGDAVADGLSASAGLTLVRRGSISDLAPVRERIGELLTPEVLAEVAARGESGAKLLVGATDLDLGRAVAFDMTLLAQRYVGAKTKTEKTRLRNCYIEALLASTIVPPGARPVFIDNRMYIDGGVRYAVFDDRIRKVPFTTFTTVRDGRIEREVSPRLHIILNADGETDTRCGKTDPDMCADPYSTEGQHKDWSILTLAFRSVDLLTSQVQRLSVDRAASRAEQLSGAAFFAKMRADDLGADGKPYAIPGFEGRNTCDAWRALDDADENPLEFHKRYMRCLIVYGRERGAARDWDEPKPEETSP